MKPSEDAEYIPLDVENAVCATSAMPLFRASIETIVFDRVGVSSDHLHGICRGSRRVVFARHLALYLLQNVGGLTASQAAMACARDRSTAVNALRHIEERRESDPSTDLAIALIEAETRRALAHVDARVRLGV